MQDSWLKFGCFITGYNYAIIKNSSEGSAKAVKKYLSALIIISIIWAFIGYSFSNRYLHANTFTSIIVSAVMIIIVIQIERQIILTTGKNGMAFIFRIIIAIVMAIVGSIIIDQIIFKEDIETEKISSIQEKVNKVLTTKTQQLDFEIASIDTMIRKKETERAILIHEITSKPFVKGTTAERKTHIIKVNGTNGMTKDSVIAKTDFTITDVVNPKAGMLPSIDKQIAELLIQKTEKQKSRITIRDDLEKELKGKTGFLDELNTLMSILTSQPIAIFVWSLVFIFFLSLEIFVLVIKIGDPNDYDKTILHQMNMRMSMIEELTNKNSKTIRN
jgi:hypothetical protein